ncbi:MAG: monofunctional biosynthetic peptidoglycan transglycosylase [Deltaproteobacteria bacterium]|nr:monofunctional biosynthetic peptidoglycan transglycosylase [Deltaproteobacteria bacterium]
MSLRFGRFRADSMAKGKKGNRVLRGIGLFLAVLLAIEAFVLVSGMVENSLLVSRNPSSTAFTRRYSWESGQPVRFDWRELRQISDSLKRAVLVSEDDAFFEHEGVDFKELEASWEINQKKHKVARGGSTISMQLVKNLYFSPAKNFLRKANEILLTLDLERRLSKDRILEIYLNVIEWGPGIYGAENASRYYFHKDAASLTAKESAYLAAILPNPAYLTTKNTKRALRRQSILLRRMSGRTLPPEVK